MNFHDSGCSTMDDHSECKNDSDTNSAECISIEDAKTVSINEDKCNDNIEKINREPGCAPMDDHSENKNDSDNTNDSDTKSAECISIDDAENVSFDGNKYDDDNIEKVNLDSGCSTMDDHSENKYDSDTNSAECISIEDVKTVSIDEDKYNDNIEKINRDSGCSTMDDHSENKNDSDTNSAECISIEDVKTVSVDEDKYNDNIEKINRESGCAPMDNHSGNKDESGNTNDSDTNSAECIFIEDDETAFVNENKCNNDTIHEIKVGNEQKDVGDEDVDINNIRKEYKEDNRYDSFNVNDNASSEEVEDNNDIDNSNEEAENNDEDMDGDNYEDFMVSDGEQSAEVDDDDFNANTDVEDNDANRSIISNDSVNDSVTNSDNDDEFTENNNENDITDCNKKNNANDGCDKGEDTNGNNKEKTFETNSIIDCDNKEENGDDDDDDDIFTDNNGEVNEDKKSDKVKDNCDIATDRNNEERCAENSDVIVISDVEEDDNVVASNEVEKDVKDNIVKAKSSSVSNGRTISVLNDKQLGVPESGTAPSEIRVKNVMADNKFQLSSPVTQSLNALKNGVPCDVCNRYYVDEVVLEHHKINDSHFKCCYCDELTTFSSRAGLSSHHNAAHATRLSATTQHRSTQQVQLMPVTCNLTPSRNENLSLLSAEQPPFIISDVRSIAPPDDQPYVSSVPRRMSVKRSMPLSKTAPPPLKRRVLENTERNFYKGGNSPICNVTRQYPNKRITTERNTEARIPENRKFRANNPNLDRYKADEVTRMPMALNSAVTITPTTNKSNPVRYKADEVNRVPIALNSAVTLIPTGTKKQTTPARRPSSYDSNNKTATVDLNSSDKFSRVRKFTCSVCKKVLSSQDTLNQHMAIHRNCPRQLPSFRCTLCAAKFSTQQDLNQHKNTFHRDDTNVRNTDLGNALIPIATNLNEINRFRSIGVRHFIQLTATVDRDGYIDLPITGVSGNTPGSSSTNTGFLRVGPLVNMKKLNK